MNWNSDRSISLSKLCVIFFSLLLAALDIGGYWLVGWYISLRGMNWQQGAGMLTTVYLGSIFGWIALWCLWGLLKNMSVSQVFVRDNVKKLRTVSWCCAAASAICLLGTVCYLPFLLLAAAAAFMALIVRIVKNVFEQAVLMKDELDFTV